MDRSPEISTEEAAIPPFRLSGLVLICFLAVGLAWALKPVDSELVSRLIADGDFDRAQEMIGSDSRSGLIEFMISRHALSADSAHIQDIARLAAATDEPERVLGLLQDGANGINPTGLIQFLEPLAGRCLQLQRPDLACQAFELIAGHAPLTDGQLSMAVTASRYCGEPDRAYAFISRNCSRRAASPLDLPPELRKVAFQVLRETNRNGEVFELLGEVFHNSTSIEEKRRTLEELIQAATLAGRTAEIAPFLSDFILETEAGRLTWAEFIQRGDRHESDEDFVRYGKLLAEHCEWRSQTHEAFDIYRKLTILGDTASLDRCTAIYRWANSDKDLAELLQLLGPGVLKPEHQLLLARLGAGFGDVAVAEKILRTLLAGDHPEKAKLWEELGHLLVSEYNRSDEAHTAYLTAIKIDPALTEAQTKAAFMYIAKGQYGEALNLYQRFPEDLHNDETITAVMQLAKALGSYPDLIRATRIRMRLADNPDPNDFADIAYYHALEGEPVQAEEALKEGAAMFPGHPGLTVNLIDFLIRSQRLEEAFDVAAAAFDDAADPRFATRLIYTGVGTDRTAETVEILGLTDPLAPSWPPPVRLRLADLYERIGKSELAMKIYRSIPQGESQALRLQRQGLTRWPRRSK